jgi:chromosome segregation ATPase
MSDLAQLQHEKSVLERKHASIVGVIHELRQRARQKSIEASATRQPLPEAEIAHWQNGIKRHQAELMEVQAKIAEVNKELRKAKADQPIKTLSQLPRDAVHAWR